jgi:hypothetical protein
MTLRYREAAKDELGDDPGQVGPDSAGQSGDTQGLSTSSDVTEESVEELVVTGQVYEADVLSGVEAAADHPERPAHTHEAQSRELEVLPEAESSPSGG